MLLPPNIYAFATLLLSISYDMASWQSIANGKIEQFFSCFISLGNVISPTNALCIILVCNPRKSSDRRASRRCRGLLALILSSRSSQERRCLPEQECRVSLWGRDDRRVEGLDYIPKLHLLYIYPRLACNDWALPQEKYRRHSLAVHWRSVREPRCDGLAKRLSAVSRRCCVPLLSCGPW